MLSVQQELSAAKLRMEQQERLGTRHALMQLLPPSRLPSNPVLEGLKAAQIAAGAAVGMPAGVAGSGGCGWVAPEAAAVGALRQSMWQLARGSGSVPCSSKPSIPGAGGEVAACRAAAPAELDAHAPASPPAVQQQPPREGHQAPIHGSSSSKAPWPLQLAAGPQVLASPTLADVVSLGSRGLTLTGLLSEEPLEELPIASAAFGRCRSQQQPHHRQSEQLQRQPLRLRRDQQSEQQWLPRQPPQPHAQGSASPGSPCMAESCASFSVVAENHSSGSAAAAAVAAGKQQSGRSRPLPLAVSPMTSAAASFVPQRSMRPEQQQRPGSVQHQHSSGALSPLASARGQPRAAGPAAAADLPGYSLLRNTDLPVAVAPAGLQRLESTLAEEAGTPGTAAPGSARRQGARITFTLTPPRRLGDSPLLQPATSDEATPISHMLRAGSSCDTAPSCFPVLQPTQPRPLQGSQDSPALLASCFKSMADGLDLKLSPLASVQATPEPLGSPCAASQQPPAVQLQPPRWALAASAAAHPSPARSLGSPLGGSGSAGRRRSALHTTSSPACREAGGMQEGRRRAAAAASPLVTPPRSLVATPGDGGSRAARALGDGDVREARPAYYPMLGFTWYRKLGRDVDSS